MSSDEPRLVYRAMTADEDGQPRLGASARALGARPLIDVTGDASDIVESGSGGMSVAFGDPILLPSHRRPPAFGGTGADPVYAIDIGDLGDNLVWRSDPDGPSGHGFLEPVRRMPFNEYQDTLWATRPRWRRMEP